MSNFPKPGAALFCQNMHDCLLFHKYFHGDNGAGLGASHQAGSTGVVARLLHLFSSVTAARVLHGGKAAFAEAIAGSRAVSLRPVRQADASFPGECAS